MILRTGVVIAVLSACSSTERPVGAVVSDSAGVEIVINPPGELPELVLEEDLRIGQIEGDERYLFDQIRSIAVSEGDSILVVNGGSATVRLYAPNGAFVREFGSKGGGPGEADALLLGGVSGDTVHVLGVGSGPPRTLLFNKAGEFLTSWPQRQADQGAVTLVGRVGDVWLASVRRFGDPASWSSGQTIIDSLRLYEVDPGTGLLGAHVLTRAGQTMNYHGGGELGAGPIFDALPQVTTSRDGFIYYTEASSHEIEVLDTNGKLLRRIRRDVPRVPVTQELVKAYKAGVDEFYRSVPNHAGKEEEIRRVRDGREPDAEYLPIIARLIVGADGSIWLERRDLQGDPVEMELNLSFGRGAEPVPQVWEIMDGDGLAVGSVRLSGYFQPHVVSTDYVVGVLRDALDVEYVVRYRLRR